MPTLTTINPLLKELTTELADGTIYNHRHPEKEPQGLAGQKAFCKWFDHAMKCGNGVLASYFVALYNWN